MSMALFLNSSLIVRHHTFSNPFLPRRLQIPSRILPLCLHPDPRIRLDFRHPPAGCSMGLKASRESEEYHARILRESGSQRDGFLRLNLGDSIGKVSAWFVVILCGILVVYCRMALASGGATEVGMRALGQEGLTKSIWVPKFLQVLRVLKEQGLILVAVLGLFAFFSMAETSITTLWPRKIDMLESSTIKEIAYKRSIVKEVAYKPAYFVPDSMSLSNLLREFIIRKVYVAVVLNEYGGTVGLVVTLENVGEEIVQKDGHQYETVSGFVCECFGYIPRIGESIQVKLENARIEENDEYVDGESETQKEKYQTFKLEILAGSARKVRKVGFEKINEENTKLNKKAITRVFPRIIP